MAKILIVDDDVAVADQVANALRTDGYLVDVALTGREASAYFCAAAYDLIILDWELPDKTGPEICYELRNSNQVQMPVLFLTARGAIDDKESSFACGADDYLTKPFNIRELSIRVKALLRRPAAVVPRKIEMRDLVLDLNARELRRGGQKVELYPKEYALIEFLMRNPNQVYSADDLLRRIWSTDSESSEETVRVTLMRVRQKVSNPDEKPALIVTLRNIGYRLQP